MNYIELGGGLGDVFNQMYRDGGYRSLDQLGPDQRTRVGLVSHNPHVKELFDHHPRAAQLQVDSLGYWLPPDDSARRAEFSLPRYAGTPVRFLEGWPETVRFHPSPRDQEVIATTLLRRSSPGGYVVLAPSGGQDDRTLPGSLALDLVEIAHDFNLTVVQVGRNYARPGRSPETDFLPDGNGTSDSINLIDTLSVPGTAAVVAAAAALITAHSSLNILAWHLGVAQVVAYPEAVQTRHFQRPDQWSFGAFDQRLSRLTVHGLFSERDRLVAQFRDLLLLNGHRC